MLLVETKTSSLLSMYAFRKGHWDVAGCQAEFVPCSSLDLSVVMELLREAAAHCCLDLQCDLK